MEISTMPTLGDWMALMTCQNNSVFDLNIQPINLNNIGTVQAEKTSYGVLLRPFYGMRRTALTEISQS